jgi:hypothetical protein
VPPNQLHSLHHSHFVHYSEVDAVLELAIDKPVAGKQVDWARFHHKQRKHIVQRRAFQPTKQR